MADHKQESYNEKVAVEQHGEPLEGEVFAVDNADHLQR